tara:strand:- start:96 stop:791 length:696 start_codon:yes stop_codon:yes gene_type:complete
MDLKIVVFAYNFPHRKTIDFIETLHESQYSISLILAANFLKIESPKSILTNHTQTVKLSSKKLAEKYQIPFYVVKHNSEQSQKLLQKYDINFGIISGARILNKEIIDCMSCGVLNFHPGLLPYIRGLDSVLWSIYKDYPLGVTAHLIDEKIDSGILVFKKKIKINGDDNFESLCEKVYQLQLSLLPIALNLIIKESGFSKLLSSGNYNSKMSYEMQLDVKNKITSYIQNHS